VGYEKEMNNEIREKFDALRIKFDKDVGYYRSMVDNLTHEIGDCKDTIKMLNLQLEETSKFATLEFPLLLRTEYRDTPNLSLDGK
jgi:hypothetical protein